MKIDVSYLQRCIATLDKANSLFINADRESLDFDMYRSACIKEFEIILEQSGKLLRKTLYYYFHSSSAVDQLIFKDVFRQAVLRSIITPEACERWLQYRDSRNRTAHDYGVNFAEEALLLIPQFIKDARDLAFAIKKQSDHNDAIT
ncbi:MAG: nucleotidyltransferase substrate binding protein [Ferruginibacter sp.]